MNWRQKLDGAAILADANAPYFAQARATLRIIESKDCPTMGVDEHWRMYVNPKFVDAMDSKMLAFVLIHEVNHLVRKHCERFKDKQGGGYGGKINIATDCEINCGVFGNLKRDNEMAYPEAYNLPPDKLAEWYYANLPDDPQKQGKGGGQGKGKGGKGKPSPGQPDGSGSDGQKREWELGADDAKNPGLNKIDQQVVIQQAAEAVQKHVKANGRGSCPAGCELWSESVVSPKVRWQSVLRHALSQGISKVGLGDRTYRRTKLRGGIIMPRHHKLQPVIAIVVDTSGSMGNGEGSVLHRALSEAIGIAKTAGTVSVVWTDAQPVLQRNVRRISDCKPVGGGGTDMACGIEFADKLKNGDHPDALICLTDMQTGWPARPTRSPLIIGAIGQTGGAPGWARVIKIEEGE